MVPSVCFRGNLKPRTGYGTIPENLGRVLESWGCRVTYDDYACGWHTHQYTDYIASRMNGFAPSPCVIHCAPPDIPFDDTEPTICLTMWEATGLPDKAIPILNRARALAVASRWNAVNFHASGVTRPIHVVPLAINAEAFRPKPRPVFGPTVFGMAARLVAGGCRKGINEGVRAFRDAFPAGDEPVAMRIRIWEDDLPYLDPVNDSRIEVSTDPVQQDGLAEWYHGLTCLFVPSKAEGFGMHTLEAMACGVPVIASRYSGTADFFDVRSGWELAYDIVPATGLYEGCGVWAEPRHDAMVDALRKAHDDRIGCVLRGMHAARVAGEYTWSHSARALMNVIESAFPSLAA